MARRARGSWIPSAIIDEEDTILTHIDNGLIKIQGDKPESNIAYNPGAGLLGPVSISYNNAVLTAFPKMGLAPTITIFHIWKSSVPQNLLRLYINWMGFR